MSLKKYSIFVTVGLCCGIMMAYIYSFHIAKVGNSRSIASTKDERHRLKMARGKHGLPIAVQIQKMDGSDPESGYYKLVATITFNQPIARVRFQWAKPDQSRVISGSLDGEIFLAAGEDTVEQIIEIQLTDTKRDSQILFDLTYDENTVPMGTSDIFVFRASPF